MPYSAFLSGVSCVSATDCFAVGDTIGDFTLPLIEHWDGTAWSQATAPALPAANGVELSGVLDAVSCVTSTDCTAVGMTENRTNPAVSGDGSTLIEHWDGTAWTVVNSPNPTGATPYSRLYSVACVSGGGCVAVGESSDAKSTLVSTLVERWDGATWSIVPSPEPTGSRYSTLQSVSCGAPQHCIAVGDTSTGHDDPAVATLIEQWDGASWTLAASPNPPGVMYSMLYAVSCVTASHCVAAGNSGGGAPVSFRTMVQQWDGTAWTMVASPNPAGDTYSRFFGLSCTSLTTCTAVGISGINHYASLIERTVTAPRFSYPVDGQSNTDTTRPITWTTTPQAQAYIVVVGSTTFGTDLANSGILPPTTSSFNMPDLPAGRMLWATLLTEFDGQWVTYQEIQFSAAPGHATFTQPLNGASNVNHVKPFTWSTISGAQGYILVIGTAVHGTDLVNSGILPAGQSAYIVPALPTGKVLYATLLTKVNGAWSRYQDIWFIAIA
jgi:hypothetical protein